MEDALADRLSDEELGDGEHVDAVRLDGMLSDGVFSDGVLSDEELEALALAADPDAPLPADAVPLDLGTPARLALLPTWYMAPVVGRRLTQKRYRVAIALLIAAFLTIDVFGLCATYGPLSLA